MKRWLVHDNSCNVDYRMYGASSEAICKAHPLLEVLQEVEDTEHLQFIDEIITNSTKIEEKPSSLPTCVKQLYKRITERGEVVIILYLDIADNHYYDICEFFESQNCKAVSLKTLMSPEEFYLRYIKDSVIKYEVLSETRHPGCGEKLPKPAELKGIKSLGNVKRDRVGNQIYIKDNDLYIYTNDYFSPTWCEFGDEGTPVSYSLNKLNEKYGQNNVIRKKFGYDDNWSAIVLRNKAWLKITNFLSFFRQGLDDSQISWKCCRMVNRYHHWNEYDGVEVDWENMYEEICKLVRQNIKGRF